MASPTLAAGRLAATRAKGRESRWYAAPVIVLAALAAVSCGSTTPAATGSAPATATPTAAAAPTPSAAPIDPCVVGSWKATAGSLPQRYNGALVTVTGGAGAVITYRADGSYSSDFANAQPYTGTTPDGHKLSVTASGKTSGAVTASAGDLELVSDQTTLTVTVRVDGVVTSTVQASRTSSAQYVCVAGRQLTLSSGSSSTQYAPAP